MAYTKKFTCIFFVMLLVIYAQPVRADIVPNAGVGEAIKQFETSVSKIVEKARDSGDDLMIRFADLLSGKISEIRELYDSALQKSISSLSKERANVFYSIDKSINKIDAVVGSNLKVVDQDFQRLLATVGPLLNSSPFVVDYEPKTLRRPCTDKPIKIVVHGMNLTVGTAILTNDSVKLEPLAASPTKLTFTATYQQVAPKGAEDAFSRFALQLNTPGGILRFGADKIWNSPVGLQFERETPVNVSVEYKKRHFIVERKSIRSIEREVTSLGGNGYVNSCLNPDKGWRLDLKSIKVRRTKSQAWLFKPVSKGGCCNGNKFILPKTMRSEGVCLTINSRPLSSKARAVAAGYLTGVQVREVRQDKIIKLQSKEVSRCSDLLIDLPEDAVGFTALAIEGKLRTFLTSETRESGSIALEPHWGEDKKLIFRFRQRGN